MNGIHFSIYLLFFFSELLIALTALRPPTAWQHAPSIGFRSEVLNFRSLVEGDFDIARQHVHAMHEERALRFTFSRSITAHI